MCPVAVLSTAGHSLHALHISMFTLLVLGMSCAAVYDRWLLINRCKSSGQSCSRTRQPTRSWQTAQRTKPICCLGNCYFGSTLDFQHTVRSDEILVSHLKGEAEKCLPVFLSSVSPTTLLWLQSLEFSFFPLVSSPLLLAEDVFLSRGGGMQEEGEEALPLFAKQQLGNSSGSNKDSTTLRWLMPACTPTRLFQAYLLHPYSH